MIQVAQFHTGAGGAFQAIRPLLLKEEQGLLVMAYSFLVWAIALAIDLLLLSGRGFDSVSGIGG